MFCRLKQGEPKRNAFLQKDNLYLQENQLTMNNFKIYLLNFAVPLHPNGRQIKEATILSSFWEFFRISLHLSTFVVTLQKKGYSPAIRANPTRI